MILVAVSANDIPQNHLRCSLREYVGLKVIRVDVECDEFIVKHSPSPKTCQENATGHAHMARKPLK